MIRYVANGLNRLIDLVDKPPHGEPSGAVKALMWPLFVVPLVLLGVMLLGLVYLMGSLAQKLGLVQWLLSTEDGYWALAGRLAALSAAFVFYLLLVAAGQLGKSLKEEK